MNRLSAAVPETPTRLNLPPTTWRPGQRETVQQIHQAPTKVVLLLAPTGSGKSVIAAAVGEMELRQNPRRWDEDDREWRGGYAITTKTIQLQDQYLRDFPALTRMVGRSNFDCAAGYEHAGVGICTTGQQCDLKGDCSYYVAKAKATAAPRLVVNYDYSILSLLKGHGGPCVGRSLLICDEGHLMDESLRTATAAAISEATIRTVDDRLGIPRPRGKDREALTNYCWRVYEDLAEIPEIFSTRLSETEYRQFRPLIAAYKQIDAVGGLLSADDEAVIIRNNGFGIQVEPVWGSTAFRDFAAYFDKIVIMSATLPNPALTAKLLGVDPDDVTTITMPSTFPADRRPFIIDPIVRVSKAKMSDDDLDTLVAALDRWLFSWSDRKGIIHCHAYWLRDAVLERSAFTDRFITHGARGLPEAIGAFKAAGPGTWLLSPTAHSGVDLPYEHVTGQLILKLPTPDLGDPAIAARKEELPETYDQAIAAGLLQAYGRGMRAEDDTCDTVVLDANMVWWFNRNRHLFPPYVQAAMSQLAA